MRVMKRQGSKKAFLKEDMTTELDQGGRAKGNLVDVQEGRWKKQDGKSKIPARWKKQG